MYKKYLILIVLVLFVAGCAEEEIGPEAGKSPYIGGTKGVIAEFEQMGVYSDESNMEEIYEGEKFPIEITLKNKGEDDVGIGNATVSLAGINLADFTGIDDGDVTPDDGITTNTVLIEKISEYNKDGGEVTIDFTSGADDAVYIVPLPGYSYDISVFAIVDYRYKTYSAVPKVCFKGDPADKTVCNVDEVKDVYSSGAPIQVVKAEEKKAGVGKIAVEFSIENTGTGRVTKPGTAYDSRYDQLSYSVSDPTEWECKSAGKINEARLSDGKATIVCRLSGTLDRSDLYTKELDLTLEYDYKEIMHKQLRVIKE